MDKEVIAFLEGYKKADAYIKEERRARLAQMTTEESRALFSALMSKYPRISPGSGSEKLQAWRLQSKLEVRRIFFLLAESKGYL